jgi:hypothetical protein
MKHEFTVDGTTFAIRPLKVKQALKVEALLVEVLLPAWGALATAGSGRIDPKALAGLERLDELVDILAPTCEVDWAKGGDATARVPLQGFLDLVFERRNAALLAWIAEAVEFNFPDFFTGSGVAILEATGNRFASLLGLTGGSGD